MAVQWGMFAYLYPRYLMTHKTKDGSVLEIPWKYVAVLGSVCFGGGFGGHLVSKATDAPAPASAEVTSVNREQVDGKLTMIIKMVNEIDTKLAVLVSQETANEKTLGSHTQQIQELEIKTAVLEDTHSVNSKN